MSTIITHDMHAGKPSILIYAPDCRTIISDTEIKGHIIKIDGDASQPFILNVRFTDCTIITDNLLAFLSCYFDRCEMQVKPLIDAQAAASKALEDCCVMISAPHNNYVIPPLPL